MKHVVAILFLLSPIIAWGDENSQVSQISQSEVMETTPSGFEAQVFVPYYQIQSMLRHDGELTEASKTSSGGLGVSAGFGRTFANHFGYQMNLAWMRFAPINGKNLEMARVAANLSMELAPQWLAFVGPNMAQFTNNGPSDAALGFQLGVRKKLTPVLSAQFARFEMNESNREDRMSRVDTRSVGYEAALIGSF